MKRKIINTLIEWKDNGERSKKPILLIGAKGVGKTYLAYDFAKSFYEQITYLNFEQDKGLSKRIIQDSFIPNKDEALSDSRILILDEIPSSPKIIRSIINIQKTEAYPYIIAILVIRF